MDEMTDFRAEEREAQQAEKAQIETVGETLSRLSRDSEDRRCFALERAIQFTGNTGDATEVTKNTKTFEAYLRGESE